MPILKKQLKYNNKDIRINEHKLFMAKSKKLYYLSQKKKDLF